MHKIGLFCARENKNPPALRVGGFCSGKTGLVLLPAVLGGNGELLAAVGAAGREDPAAVRRAHTLAEAVLVDTLAAGRLECSFHCISFLYYSLIQLRFFTRTAKVGIFAQSAK